MMMFSKVCSSCNISACSAGSDVDGPARITAPSCLGSHMVAMDCGIGANICLCDAMLQQFHYPRKSGMVCPLDSFHGD